MGSKATSPKYSSFPKIERDSLSREILQYGNLIFDREDVKNEYSLWLKQKTGNQSGKTIDTRSLHDEALLIIRSKP